MSDNLKKFLEAVSEKPEMVEKVNAMSQEGVIALAKEMGFALTEADFAKPAVEELDDEDLDTVAGGQKVSCTCVLGGGGKGDSNDKTCACVAAGMGYTKRGQDRCFCAIGGAGYDY